jgi:hypothetical protein
MYAYNLEIGGGFFQGVRAPGNANAHSYDPPPPRNTKESEPWLWGSGPKRITSHATVGGDLA